MSAKSDKLRSKVTASRQKTDEAKASLAADKSENAVLNSLNKLKVQGRIKGFHVSSLQFPIMPLSIVGSARRSRRHR